VEIGMHVLDPQRCMPGIPGKPGVDAQREGMWVQDVHTLSSATPSQSSSIPLQTCGSLAGTCVGLRHS
jgi:hypothetical protein